MGEVVSDTSGEMIQKLSGIRSVHAALLFSVTASRSRNRHFTDAAFSNSPQPCTPPSAFTCPLLHLSPVCLSLSLCISELLTTRISADSCVRSVPTSTCPAFSSASAQSS